MMAGTLFTTRKKRKADTEDIISDLPQHLIDKILERMPIRDAAKTSILSRKWRCNWVTLPKLLFDRVFLEETFKRKPFNDFEYVALISKILLLHRGPIHTFNLHVPKFNSDRSSDIDQWIQFLSRNGIRNLIVNNRNNRPYTLSSHTFSCPDLTGLQIVNFVIKPPESYRCFRKVVTLVFQGIAFAANLLPQTLFSNAPLLQSLCILNCTGIDHFYIDAPNLKTLLVHSYYQFKSLEFKNTPNLTIASFTHGYIVARPDQSKASGFTELLRSLPRIVCLTFDGCLLKILGAGTVPRRLPITIKHLKKLSLQRIDLTDLNQISCALCLLRSSTNLMELGITVFQTKNTVNDPVFNFMDERDLNLDRLQTVRFKFYKGSRAELLFVKFILAHCKSLERMLVEYNGVAVSNEWFRVSKELMRFSRASKKAEVIYVEPGSRMMVPFPVYLN